MMKRPAGRARKGRSEASGGTSERSPQGGVIKESSTAKVFLNQLHSTRVL